MDAIPLLNTSLVNIGAMVIMIVIALGSQALRRRQKAGFILVFSIIVLIITAQLTTVYLMGRSHRFWLLNLVAYLTGYLLTPLLPILFGSAVTDYRHIRPRLIWFSFYALILLLAVLHGYVFVVTPDNHYYRTDGFWIFLTAYGLGVVSMIRETVRLCMHYQGTTRLPIVLMAIYLTAGTLVQVVIPYSYVTWSCVCFVAILYYLYCSDLWVHVDALTGLLNHGTYLNRAQDLKPGTTLLLFDVDRFKEVNDTYGHLFGDQCLIRVARTIRAVYGPYGMCYRIGGDEFAAIITRKDFKPQDREKKFSHFIQQQRLGLPGMPDVSLGMAVYQPGQSITDLINQADRNMYEQKHLRHS